MRTLFSIVFLLVFSSLSAYDLIHHGSDFEAYQRTMSYEQVDEKIKKQLQKDQEVSLWYRLSQEKLDILGPEDEKGDRPIEFTLFFGNKPKPCAHKISSFQALPLLGWRIAIDPGHMGGDLAQLEEKYIDMPINLEKGILKNYFFDEGTLALETAKKLAHELKELGAEVFLTKDYVGHGVLEKEFKAWKKEDLEQAISTLISRQDNPSLQEEEKLYWTTKASETEIFRSTYNFLDVFERAEKINAFKPDLTLCCHYNLGGIYDKQGKTPGTEDNYFLFFVPGAFKKGSTKDEVFRNSSLKSPRARYEFVRLLVTDDLDQSIRLAKKAFKHTKDTLGLPPGDHWAGITPFCLKQDSGIYHRNLTLTRNVHSPILYGEPLCQDNFKCVKQLAEHPEQVVDQIVHIYTQAVLDWAQSFESVK